MQACIVFLNVKKIKITICALTMRMESVICILFSAYQLVSSSYERTTGAISKYFPHHKIEEQRSVSIGTESSIKEHGLVSQHKEKMHKARAVRVDSRSKFSCDYESTCHSQITNQNAEFNSEGLVSG